MSYPAFGFYRTGTFWGYKLCCIPQCQTDRRILILRVIGCFDHLVRHMVWLLSLDGFWERISQDRPSSRNVEVDCFHIPAYTLRRPLFPQECLRSLSDFQLQGVLDQSSKTWMECCYVGTAAAFWTCDVFVTIPCHVYNGAATFEAYALLCK